MHFSVDVKSVCTLCPLTSVSGYRTGGFKKPVEGMLGVFSNKKKRLRLKLIETLFTTKMYIRSTVSFLCYFMYILQELKQVCLDKTRGWVIYR